MSEQPKDDPKVPNLEETVIAMTPVQRKRAGFELWASKDIGNKELLEEWEENQGLIYLFYFFFVLLLIWKFWEVLE